MTDQCCSAEALRVRIYVLKSMEQLKALPVALASMSGLNKLMVHHHALMGPNGDHVLVNTSMIIINMTTTCFMIVAALKRASLSCTRRVKNHMGQ